MSASRILFASYHAAFDPSNGAARTMRDMMHLFAEAGCTTASLSGPCVDAKDARGREVITTMLRDEGRTFSRHSPSLYVANDRGTPSFAYAPNMANHAEPPEGNARAFEKVLESLVDALAPEIVLTYGGGAIGRAVIAAAKRKGAKVVFRIMNMRYARRDLFDAVDGILTPSQFVADAYQRTLGISPKNIPCPLDWTRTIASERAPRFLTYVAPAPDKGLPLAARILDELVAKRTDIPVLVVEGRGNLAAFAAATNAATRAHVMASKTVADPRSFLAVTRALLMPSFVEPSGRLAQEAVLNEIPVVASDRDGLPETLSEAGICLPATPDVGPWLAAIERLWDDPAHEAAERARCAGAKERWRPATLARAYLDYFASLAPSVPPSAAPGKSDIATLLAEARAFPAARERANVAPPLLSLVPLSKCG